MAGGSGPKTIWISKSARGIAVLLTFPAAVLAIAGNLLLDSVAFLMLICAAPSRTILRISPVPSFCRLFKPPGHLGGLGQLGRMRPPMGGGALVRHILCIDYLKVKA